MTSKKDDTIKKRIHALLRHLVNARIERLRSLIATGRTYKGKKQK